MPWPTSMILNPLAPSSNFSINRRSKGMPTTKKAEASPRATNCLGVGENPCGSCSGPARVSTSIRSPAIRLANPAMGATETKTTGFPEVDLPVPWEPRSHPTNPRVKTRKTPDIAATRREKGEGFINATKLHLAPCQPHPLRNGIDHRRRSLIFCALAPGSPDLRSDPPPSNTPHLHSCATPPFSRS